MLLLLEIGRLIAALTRSFLVLVFGGVYQGKQELGVLFPQLGVFFELLPVPAQDLLVPGEPLLRGFVLLLCSATLFSSSRRGFFSTPQTVVKFSICN